MKVLKAMTSAVITRMIRCSTNNNINNKCLTILEKEQMFNSQD